jgi:hypothetical protein
VVHTAVAASEAGETVVIIDTDPQKAQRYGEKPASKRRLLLQPPLPQNSTGYSAQHYKSK